MDQRQDLIDCDPFCSANPKNHRGGRWSRMHVLDTTDPDYSTVEQQFYDGWKHPHKKRPGVKAIFRIISPASFHIPYYQHRDRVCNDLSGLMRRTISSPNEQFLFHGTNRACSLGEDRSSVHLCTLAECHLCCIVRNSFDIRKCGTKNKFHLAQAFIRPPFHQADDYSQNMDRTMSTRVVLLNRVVVGNPKRRRYNATNLTTPPSGCHSIIGEPGADLNYEETVVYNNDAIRPAFLIVYREDVDTLKPKPTLQGFIKTLFKTPIAT